MTQICIRPNPEVLKALRANSLATEYSLCEFVDNAQSADADRVDFDIKHSKDINTNGIYVGAKVTITDNGKGMDLATLIECLRYACRTKKKGISRFGFGLKTGAFSIGRQVRIISQELKGFAHEVVVNMNKVGDDWLIDAPVQVASPFPEGHGTFIEITDIDRPLSQDNEIIKRLSMIYDLSLQGVAPYTKITLRVNKKCVFAANTMCNQSVSNGQPLCIPSIVLPQTFTYNGKVYSYKVEQTIIAHGNRNGVNAKESGVLVYYNGRCLDLGKNNPYDTSWFETLEPHPGNSHLRVAIHLDSSFDSFIEFEHEKCRVALSKVFIAHIKPLMTTWHSIMRTHYTSCPSYVAAQAARVLATATKYGSPPPVPVVVPIKPQNPPPIHHTLTTHTCPKCGHTF